MSHTPLPDHIPQALRDCFSAQRAAFQNARCPSLQERRQDLRALHRLGQRCGAFILRQPERGLRAQHFLHRGDGRAHAGHAAGQRLQRRHGVTLVARAQHRGLPGPVGLCGHGLLAVQVQAALGQQVLPGAAHRAHQLAIAHHMQLAGSRQKAQHGQQLQRLFFGGQTAHKTERHHLRSERGHGLIHPSRTGQDRRVADHAHAGLDGTPGFGPGTGHHAHQAVARGL